MGSQIAESSVQNTGSWTSSVMALTWAHRPAPPALQAKREQQRQANLDLKRVLEQRDEELAAARETNLRLMNQLNRPAS